MTRTKTLLSCVLLSALLVFGCGGDADDNSDEFVYPNQEDAPAELVGIWVFRSVMVNGAEQALADVMEWQPTSFEARLSIASWGACGFSEVDSRGEQTTRESCIVFVEGNEMDFQFLSPDGRTVVEELATTFTLSGGTLTITTVEEGDTVVFTLTMSMNQRT